MAPDNHKWTNLIRQIREDVSTKPVFITTRESAEKSAKTLLEDKAGSFSTSDLAHFLDFCNTEIVPPDRNTIRLRDKETLTRFQLSFIGQNRKLMINSLESCNFWIKGLWTENIDNYHVLSQFWTENQVPGAGVGLPTMILYLKDPDHFNVWLPFLNNAISVFSNQEISLTRNAENYHKFNDIVNKNLRQPFNLKPQEVDYILYRINAEFSKP